MALYGKSGDDVREDLGILRERVRVLEKKGNITPPPGSDDEAAIGVAVSNIKGSATVKELAAKFNELLDSLRGAGVIEDA